MKRHIKSYLIFTSSIYRIVMFNLMPLVLIAALACGGNALIHWRKETIFYTNSGIAESVACLSMIIIPFIEILSDNWLFCGIQSKHAEKMDYLKTSSAGMPVLRKALRMDLIRRFVSTVVISVAAYIVLAFVYKKPVEDLHMLSDYEKSQYFFDIVKDLYIVLLGILIAYGVSVLGIMISRYGNMLWINLLVSYVVLFVTIMVIHILLLFVVFFLLFPTWLFIQMVQLFIIADIAVSILAVKKAMKKMEESYYDK